MGAGMSRFFALLLAVLALEGCQHIPPKVAAGCTIPAYPLTFSNASGVLTGDSVHISVGLPPAPSGPPKTFGDVVSDTLSGGDLDRLRPMTVGINRQVLVLSGGSLHGAFGAGFFKGLNGVPPYEIVTAVSTGALQSTFIFLANRPDPIDPKDPGRRMFAPYMSKAPVIARPGDSNLGDLELAYAIERESDLMKVSKLGYVGAALNGSIATFTSLKAALTGLISDTTLVQVAEEAKAGRRLFVGVANLDDGKGYALDLTAMVLDAYNADPGNPEQAVDRVRGCYVDALIASASVPPGVPPVSLTLDMDPKGTHRTEHHMFMDGGALFGVFFQQVHDGATTPWTKGKTPTPTDITLIVNGSLYGEPWTDSKGQAVKKWSVVNFGLRAVDLLQTQVYRFSVDEIEKWALPNGKLRMAFISNENLGTDAELPDDHWFTNSLGEKKKCGEFRAEDKATSHPQEFDAKYMQCLIDYGRSRGSAANPWNHVVPQSPVPAL